MNIFFGLFVFGAFAGITSVCFEVLTGLPPFGLVTAFFGPVFYRAEGLAPYVLEALADNLTVGLYIHSYEIARIIDDPRNLMDALSFVENEYGVTPQSVRFVERVLSGREIFLAKFPIPSEAVSHLYLPTDGSSSNWFIKVLLNVFPQIKLSFQVFEQVHQHPSSTSNLWFLLSYYHRDFSFI